MCNALSADDDAGPSNKRTIFFFFFVLQETIPFFLFQSFSTAIFLAIAFSERKERKENNSTKIIPRTTHKAPNIRSPQQRPHTHLIPQTATSSIYSRVSNPIQKRHYKEQKKTQSETFSHRYTIFFFLARGYTEHQKKSSANNENSPTTRQPFCAEPAADQLPSTATLDTDESGK